LGTRLFQKKFIRSNKIMRILLLGSSPTENNYFASRLLSKSKASWIVVSSYEASRLLWANVKSVTKITEPKAVDEAPNTDNCGLVVEVMGTSFFEKNWVKEKIKNMENLLVLSTNPAVLDKDCKFDKTFICKTVSGEKQIQYHTLYIDAKTTALMEFKKVLRSLGKNQYLDVVNGKYTVLELPEDPEEKKERPAVSVDRIGNQSPRSVDRIGNRQGSESLQDSRRGSDNIVSGSEIVRPKTVNNAEEKVGQASVPVSAALLPKYSIMTKPEKIVVEENVSEVWLHFVPREKQIDDCIGAFEEMLSNNLILSMFTQAYHERLSDGSVSVYFQVYLQRQDLFFAFVLNMLQTMKTNHLITHGGLVL